MARLEMTYNKSEFMLFRKLKDIFPELRAQALGYVGDAGKERLYYYFLMGQELTFKKDPLVALDKIGRRMVHYKVGKRAGYVKIGSYPVNLFERGRMLRSGKKERGKHIILGKFKNLMNADLQGIVNEFDRTLLQRYLDTVVERKLAHEAASARAIAGAKTKASRK